MSNRVTLATAVEFHGEIARLHAEIERLRSALAAYTEGVSADAETKPRLTDAEREALVEMAHWCEVDSGYCREADEHRAADFYAARAATLRGLLERLSPPATPQSYGRSDETATHSHTAGGPTAQKMSQNDSF